ncbi:DUF1254 domain-containing protein [Synechococcus sp. RedBA-s]|nr:DUF1254 domain-containing protein [Synechococcus sp. RedBA-s]
MVAGPKWKGNKPEGIAKVFRSETQFSLIIFRTQLFNAADINNVKKVQAGIRAEPLSAFLKQPAPPAARRPPHRHRVPAFRWPGPVQDRLRGHPRLPAAVRARGGGRKGAARQVRQHRHRPGQDLQLQ